MGVVEVITWLLREEHQLPWVIYICISPSGVQNLTAIEFIYLIELNSNLIIKKKRCKLIQKNIENLLMTMVLKKENLKRNRVKKTLSISLYLGMR